MQETLTRFSSIIDNPYERLARWKKQTKGKIFGCFPMHVPEELIHAEGILPIIILDSDEDITIADRYIQAYLCSLVLSKFDMVLRGKLDFLDGIVLPNICDFMEQLPDIWRIHLSTPPLWDLQLAAGDLHKPSVRRYLIDQFTDFKASLEESFGQEITDQRLRQSIAIYNRNRSLLSRLYQLRRANPGLFRAEDMVTVVTAGMLMPKEEHSELLTELLARAEGARPALNGKSRLVLTGNLCDQPAKGILELIDKLGVVIVDDDLYTGRRYFATQVDETLDPIEALVERYINDVPCPTKSDTDKDWADYIITLARETKANGVLMLRVINCEPHGFDYPYLKDRLTQADIPLLMIETEHKLSMEPVKTRVQAFIETLKGV